MAAMESYTHPDSGESSPLSRDIDCDNNSTTVAASYKVKFLCSYGGKIQPRPHDNRLSYVGGDTKILSLDRHSKFPAVLAKLSTLSDSSSVKYQLPGEDLDALISVTDDDDLEHMMIEHDRLTRTSIKPARLRIFLFPLIHKPTISPAVTSPNPDFLFGFDNPDPNSADRSSESQTERLRIGEEDVRGTNSDCPCKIQEKTAPAATMASPYYYPVDQRPIYVIQSLPGVYHHNDPYSGMGYKVCYDMAGRPLYYAVPVGGLAPQKGMDTVVVDGRGIGSDGEGVGGKVVPQTSAV